MTESRHRSYCFTINNYTWDDIDQFLLIECKYKCFGFETGKNQTEHMQGYIQFHNAMRFASVKKMLPRAHLEVAKGTPAQNIAYCSKEGEEDFYEFGDKPNEGGAVRKKTLADIEAELADPLNNLSTVRYYSSAYKEATRMVLAKEKASRETKFYCYTPIQDTLSEIQSKFSEDIKWVVITRFEELGYYNETNITHLIYDPDYHDEQINVKTMNYWPRGKPIMYKHGYEWCDIKPEIFVYVTATPQYYPLYKNL